uniref:Digestive organ expansion factor homolog n=1 Tax=Dermatophagoides pteronyssinus TaxID=6956 RepID=A0A6P6Y8E2_DERPT|nr:digestive organ expansion factor homolog [Dermatophagoides pteronyssinus]
MARKHGIKRKTAIINDNNDNDDKKLQRKEAKHLKDFGEKHPINDKIRLEDRCAKRVYETNDENEKKIDDIDQSSSTNMVEKSNLQPDYYEQLLDVFGKNKDVAPESDSSDGDDDDQMESTVQSSQNDNEDSEEDFNSEDEDANDNDDDDDDEQQMKPGNNINDNFVRHFFTNFQSNDIELLKTSKQQQTINHSYRYPNIGTFIESRSSIECFNLIRIDNQPPINLDSIQLRPSLRENISKTMLKLTNKKHQALTSFQLELLSLLMTYKNLFYPERTMNNSEQIRLVYSLHALNHILRTRSRIISHNSKIKNNLNHQNIMDKEEYRDQGLTRPKVLIVLPFRHSAYLTVNLMIDLLFGDNKDSGEKKIHLMNYKRFVKEFGPGSMDDQLRISSRKPDDYKQLFAGNIDDSFRLGLSLTKKSLKLYSDFYSSDIIIASPLGLRLIIGASGDEKRDYDFLSSLDMVILDQTDIFLMQNWEHVLHLFDHLHRKPRETHGVDFSRVKLWILELWSKFYYQLILFTSIESTMINGFFNKFSTNFDGKLIIRNEIDHNHSAINHVYIQCSQIFQRFECETFGQKMADARFEFFTQKILPKFRHDPMMIRTMIFIPSYFDFVRLRNYFRNEDISFSQICEYSKPGKVAKARHIFFYGGRHFLLYTERYHFYHRPTIKGIRHLIFYEPPLYSKFYSEMINSMNYSNQGKKMFTDYSSMTVTVLYNKFDIPTLLPLIGTKSMSKLLSSSSASTSNNVHMFITENILH